MATVDIEIWSDILCPFCYIGKRKLEAALEQFPHKNSVKIVWRSFQLDTRAELNPGVTIYEKLAAKYGKSLEQSKQMVANVASQATDVGLHFDFDNAVITNSRDAHRLTHLAAKRDLQDKAQEKLMSAYLLEGKHIGDFDTLVQLGIDIGLDGAEVKEMLESNQYASEVAAEQRQASYLGVRGVPFFWFNGKFAVSGAQPVHVFSDALDRAWQDAASNATPIGTQANTCGPAGCDL